MEIADLTQNQMLIAAAAGAFLVGVVIARLIFKERDRAEEDPRNHRIRELEADLRSLRRKYEESEDVLERTTTDFNIAVEELRTSKNNAIDKDEEIDRLSAELKHSVIRTRELRQELQDRASETIREHVRAREAETELEVARAGSEAVLSEINRLQEERENLTNTMRKLEENMFADDELFGEDADRNR